MKKVLFLALSISFLLISCNQTTKETIDRTNKTLSNGKRLVVEKINKETTSKGIFSNHNYGTSHRFTYSLSIQPGAITWDEGSAEPKHIIFCKDSTYIRYLKKKRIKTTYTDTTNNTSSYNHHYDIIEFYQKHIDKRYFFKLLGDDYWIDIPSDNYFTIKESCKEYLIPNDNELLLKPVIDTIFKK